MASSEEVEAFGVREEVGAEGPGGERRIVLAEVSVFPHIARVVNGFSEGEVEGMRSVSGVI